MEKVLCEQKNINNERCCGTALRQGRSSVVGVEEMNGCGNVAKLCINLDLL